MPKILNRTGHRSSWQKTTKVLLLAVTSLLVYGVSGADAALTCGSCHGNPPADNSTTVRNNPAGTFKGSHTLHNGYTCTQCHIDNGTAMSHSSGKIEMASPINGNSGATYSKTASFFISYSTNLKAGSCSLNYCHGASSPTWGANTANGCKKCHSDNTATTTFTTTAQTTNTPSSNIHVSHINKTHGISAAIACSECHTYPATVNQAGHLGSALPAEVPLAGALATAKSHTPVYSNDANRTCSNTYCHETVTPNWNATVLNGTFADCTKCHAIPPATPTHTGYSATDFPGLSVCAGCHTAVLASPTDYSHVFTNPALHIDGNVSVDCLSCHGGIKNSRYAAAAHFNYSSHHVQGRAVTNADCFQCHAEAADTVGTRSAQHTGIANSGASVDLIVWGTGARGTSYISYTANGSRKQIAKLNTHCLSCHNTPNAGFAPFGDGYATDKYSPEARLASPKTKTSIQSRYSSTRTVAWSQYKYSTATGGASRFGTNNKYMITKALSAHGNATKNQFPNWAATSGEDDWTSVDSASATLGPNRNVFCYDCHNSHGSDASGITSSYSSVTKKGALLKSTVQGFGGYKVTYKPAPRTIFYKNYSTTSTTSAKFNSGASICNDCHNNDTSKVNIARPWTITGTYSSTKAIVGYWSTPYFDNYTFASTKRTVYKAGGSVGTNKDLRKPMGGHFGSSVNGTSAAHTTEINGLCTPCHDPHGVSNALGADRDHGVPLLKGTWVTSPYREDKADILVKRGGGSTNFNGFNASGAVPGYHIDQNTFMTTPVPYNGGAATQTAVQNKRSQRFRSFSNLSSAQNGTNMPNLAVGTFAGLCMECHSQLALTNQASGRPASGAAWMTKERVHQSVSGWASSTATGTDNQNNRRHAYTCAKCHAPHVSRLPRLLVTNCLDVRHFGQRASGGSIAATPTTSTPGNMLQSSVAGPSTITSGSGAGRFPSGGGRYSGTPGSSQNSGGWWFQTNGAAGTAPPSTYDSTTNFGNTQCHNGSTSGGTTYDPTKQIWNKKSRW